MEEKIIISGIEVGTWVYSCKPAYSIPILDYKFGIEVGVDVTKLKESLGSIGKLLGEKSDDFINKIKENVPSGFIKINISVSVGRILELCKTDPDSAMLLGYWVELSGHFAGEVTLPSGVKIWMKLDLGFVLDRKIKECECVKDEKNTFFLPGGSGDAVVVLPPGSDLGSLLIASRQISVMPFSSSTVSDTSFEALKQQNERLSQRLSVEELMLIAQANTIEEAIALLKQRRGPQLEAPDD